MSNIEDVLYEARGLGIYNKVMDQVVIIKANHPFMPLQEVYSKALNETRNKLKK